jgi:nucleoid-associated protein Lsr2
MAIRTTSALEDDLDGGPADQTLQFSLDGSEYEIDLNASNVKAFRRQLAPFLDHARVAPLVGSRKGSRAARTASSRKRSRQIRAWARDQGIVVSDRGRIPGDVTERYDAAARQLLTAPADPLSAWRALRAAEGRRATLIDLYALAAAPDVLDHRCASSRVIDCSGFSTWAL